MGALQALLLMRRQAAAFPQLDPPHLIALIRSIDADATGLDFDAAEHLDILVARDISIDDVLDFYRRCIASVLLAYRMSWARVITRGRTALLNQLTRDERQSFRIAGLLEDIPSPECVRWWEYISAEMRFATDQAKRAIAREAEKLTIEYELVRLDGLGISLQPRWVALDDNGAGYDILSYDNGPIGPVNRLIEVKSTVASPLRFYVSRNEWNVAEARGASYHFHIWDMTPNPPRLYQRTSDQIRPHIPSDNEAGKWSAAEIPLR